MWTTNDYEQYHKNVQNTTHMLKFKIGMAQTTEWLPAILDYMKNANSSISAV